MYMNFGVLLGWFQIASHPILVHVHMPSRHENCKFGWLRPMIFSQALSCIETDKYFCKQYFVFITEDP